MTVYVWEIAAASHSRHEYLRSLIGTDNLFIDHGEWKLKSTFTPLNVKGRGKVLSPATLSLYSRYGGPQIDASIVAQAP